MENIKITQELLRDYLNCYLNKAGDEFSLAELMSIDTLQIDTVDIVGDFFPIDLDIIKYFINVKELEIRNVRITSDDMENISRLNSLKRLMFVDCEFESIDLNPKNLEYLKIAGGDIFDFEFLEDLTSLKELELIGVGNLDISVLNKLKNLNKLVLTKSQIMNVLPLNLNLNELRINYVQGLDLKRLTLNLKNLKKLVINNGQKGLFKDTLVYLYRSGVEIRNSHDELVEFGGEV